MVVRNLRYFARDRTYIYICDTTVHLDGKPLKLDIATKFLGVHLDSKLNFNKHIKYIAKKATTSLRQCRKAVGPTWGLTSKSCKWIYEKAIRPILSYGSLVWINALKKKHNINAVYYWCY